MSIFFSSVAHYHETIERKMKTNMKKVVYNFCLQFTIFLTMKNARKYVFVSYANIRKVNFVIYLGTSFSAELSVDCSRHNLRS